MESKYDPMPDSYRETLFMASIKNRLVREKQVVKTELEDFTLDEVKAVMLDKSPVSLWVIGYSELKPCIHITKRIMPSHGGVWMHYDSWANKESKLFTWEQFYRELKKAGLHAIRF